MKVPDWWIRLYALEDAADVAGAEKLRKEFEEKYPKEVWNISTKVEKENE